MTSTDRIEKTVVLKAPRGRVWRALTDSKEFSEWFDVKFTAPFRPGQPSSGTITLKGYENLTMIILVDRIDPESFFSFRWHPYALDPAVDYTKEATTLVAFTLEDVPEGTRLTVVESGFDAVPAERRAQAFRMNENGWGQQMKNIERHVSGRP